MFRSKRTIALIMVLAGLFLWPQSRGDSDSAGATERPGSTRGIMALDLEQLLELEIQSASGQPLTTRAAPAVVTIVTREEIRQSGARDLIDVLQLVAGFDFGVDIWGVIGLGFRGHWGHEAKIMLAIDGLVLNELTYGNLTLGNHIPVDQVERIEILRGPGSVIHGNFAELAVIHVITSIGEERTGLHGVLTAGFFDSGQARTNLCASYGSGTGSDGYLGVSAFGAVARRSDRTYTDIYGASYDMRSEHDLRTLSVGVNFRRGSFQARYLHDGYRTTHRDGYDAILPRSYGADFVSDLASIDWKLETSSNVTITPAVKATVQSPWRSTDVPQDDFMYYDPVAQQYQGSLRIDWTAHRRFHLFGGGQYAWDGARYSIESPYVFSNGKRTLKFWRYAVFLEGQLDTRIAQMTAGLRFEEHRDYDPAVVPRLGLTRAFGDTHAKLIYNGAFRTPTIEQLSTGVDITTERADVYEAELGHRFGDHLYAGVNLFEIHVRDPLVYVYDNETNLDGFFNLRDLGTRGIEAEARLHGDWGRATARYSHYRATDRGAEYYAAAEDDRLFLAFPAHKLTGTLTWRITPAFSINPSVIWTSERHAYTQADPASGDAIPDRLDPEALIHLYLLYDSRIDLGFGVYDLFGAGHDFVQPYNGLHAPLPGPGREFLLRIGFGLD